MNGMRIVILRSKPHPMNRYFSLTLIAIILIGAGTSCMRNVTMNAMRPAEITFPSEINTLLLVDRTKFEKKGLNILEGVLTGELPGSDKAALQEAMSAFQRTLARTPRFEVKRSSESFFGNSITAAFPDPLSWNDIENLCKKHGADAVVAIELFDTDFVITDGKRMVKKTVERNGEKQQVEVPEFFAEGIGNVTMGFRVYDPGGRNIIDQQLFTQTNTWEATGSSIKDAVAHLIARQEATKFVSNRAAADYAFKIAPMPIRITRDFYAKKKRVPEMGTGTRMADVNDWQGAMSAWKEAIPYARHKDAGKLCYNVAIAYEVLGDLEEAQNWASKAYVEYGNKKARQYKSVLAARARQEERVREQMK